MVLIKPEEEKLLGVEEPRMMNGKCLLVLRDCCCVECTSYKNDTIKEFIQSIALLKNIDEEETLLVCIHDI